MVGQPHLLILEQIIVEMVFGTRSNQTNVMMGIQSLAMVVIAHVTLKPVGTVLEAQIMDQIHVVLNEEMV